MRNRSLAFALAALTCAAVAAHAAEKPATSPADMEKAMMDAMTKAATPGAEHQNLAKMAGDWTTEISMTMMPGQPPMKSTGTMHAEMMLGGRYLSSTWKGKMGDMDFEGHGVDAYDNVARQYESSWVDNMGTGIMNGTGTCEGGTCTAKMEMWDPMSGQKSTSRSTMTWMGSDSFKMEMFGNGPDGKEMKFMEIVAKRNKM
jgi:uncharacterized protein DUF1579